MLIKVNMVKRNTRKRKIKTKDGQFKLTCGTHDRQNPSVIYINGQSWVTPVHDDIPTIVANVEKVTKREISKMFSKDIFNKDRFLFDVDITTSRLLKGKKSLLTFDLFLLQNETLSFDDSNIINEVNKISNKITCFINNKIGNDVIFSKEKAD